MSNRITGRAVRLSLSVSVAAMAMGLVPTFGAAPARAAECLLDTNNNGTADPADTDQGASAADPESLACGSAASAPGARSTAIGANSSAPSDNATAVGGSATAAL